MQSIMRQHLSNTQHRLTSGSECNSFDKHADIYKLTHTDLQKWITKSNVGYLWPT